MTERLQTTEELKGILEAEACLILLGNLGISPVGKMLVFKKDTTKGEITLEEVDIKNMLLTEFK